MELSVLNRRISASSTNGTMLKYLEGNFHYFSFFLLFFLSFFLFLCQFEVTIYLFTCLINWANFFEGKLYVCFPPLTTPLFLSSKVFFYFLFVYQSLFYLFLTVYQLYCTLSKICICIVECRKPNVWKPNNAESRTIDRTDLVWILVVRFIRSFGFQTDH